MLLLLCFRALKWTEIIFGKGLRTSHLTVFFPNFLFDPPENRKGEWKKIITNTYVSHCSILFPISTSKYFVAIAWTTAKFSGIPSRTAYEREHIEREDMINEI